MLTHERYDELCALAVAGELIEAEHAEFRAHLATCELCRVAYADYSEVAHVHLPATDRAARPAGAMLPPRDEFRQRFLRRARSQGCAISDGALAHRGFRWPLRMPQVPLYQAVLGTAIAALLAVAGLLWYASVAHQREVAALRKQLAQATVEIGDLSLAARQAEQNARPADDGAAPQPAELAAAEAKVQELDRILKQSLAEKAQLEQQLAQLAAEKTHLDQRVVAVEQDASSSRATAEQFRAAADDKEATFVALHARIAELADQVKMQTASLERERSLLSAGREIRDIMGARDLHLIDVQDRAADGKHQPFGRIFLTEGKSLIFYAYDLENAGVKNASFQAWGQREDGTRKAVNLGILMMDDNKQSRWLLKVEDPNVLHEIDSVFVTVEPSGGGTKPSGKQLLYAYLRNPINHP